MGFGDWRWPFAKRKQGAGDEAGGGENAGKEAARADGPGEAPASPSPPQAGTTGDDGEGGGATTGSSWREASASAHLMGHILQKGWQVGSVVGVPIIGVQAWRFGVRAALNPAVAGRTMALSALGGVALSGALGAAKISTIPDTEGVEVRADQRSCQRSLERGNGVGRAAARCWCLTSAPTGDTRLKV